MGLADRLFDVKDDILQAAMWRVKECTCSEGCPSCVGPDRLNKKLTGEVLKRILTSMFGSEEAKRQD